MVSSDVDRHTQLRDSNYCLLDSLLNHRRFYLFEETLMFILSKLVRPARAPRWSREMVATPSSPSSSDSDPTPPGFSTSDDSLTTSSSPPPSVLGKRTAPDPPVETQRAKGPRLANSLPLPTPQPMRVSLPRACKRPRDNPTPAPVKRSRLTTSSSQPNLVTPSTSSTTPLPL